MIQQCQRVLLLKNFHQLRQLSRSRSSELIYVVM
jgi:hypothetical protein